MLVSRTSAYTSRSSRWARSDGSHAIDTITRGNSRNGLAFGPWVRSTFAISSLLTISNSRPNFSRISSCHFSDRLGGQTMIDRPGAVPQQQLLDDQARLDRLAEAHVVGEQQVRPRGLQGAAQRLELVGLDVRAAAERRLEGVAVRRGDRAPAHGVHEGGERVRVVEAVRADRLRQALVRGDGVADLELPHDREFLAQAVLFQGLQPTTWVRPASASSAGLRGRPCARTSATAQVAPRTLTIWPCSGRGGTCAAAGTPRSVRKNDLQGGCQPDQPPRRPTVLSR